MPRKILMMPAERNTVADDMMSWGDVPADYELRAGPVDRNGEDDDEAPQFYSPPRKPQPK